ncbi:MAG TPA: OsmC family protein [Desulfomonilaceae bacterium]|nr:OsmC family protein [Desulfomonilaceae bacterium]
MALQAPAEKLGTVNGVDVDQLFATIEAIKGDPDIAKFQFRVKNNWINGGHNHVTIKDFYGAKQEHLHGTTFDLDAGEHQVLLGEDNGPNPVEYLLTGLSGCLTSALIYHAAAKGIKIKALQSRVEGDLDLRGFLGLSEDVPVGYKQIRVYFKIDADVSEQQKQELIEIAQKYSPVFNSVVNPTSVSVSLEK